MKENPQGGGGGDEEGRVQARGEEMSMADRIDIVIFASLCTLGIFLIIWVSILICGEEPLVGKEYEFVSGMALYTFSAMTIIFTISFLFRPSFYSTCELVYTKHSHTIMSSTLAFVLSMTILFLLIRISYIIFPKDDM